MNKMVKVVMAAALASASVSASAWWGWGPTGWGDDFVGDAGFNFNVNANARSHGWGRYYDYYAPYWSYPNGGVAPYALSAEQQQALSQQQKAFAEQQVQFLQQAVEAQRKLAEQWAANPSQAPAPFAQAIRIQDMERKLIERAAADERRFFERVREDLATQPVPFSAPEDFGSFEDRIKEMEAQREQSKQEMTALREEAMKDMDARRAEALKRFEAQRKAARERSSAAL
jgi:hypothetical protein